MNRQIITKLMVTGVIASLELSLALSPVKAQQNVYFICNQGYDKETNRRLPTTYAWYQGQKRVLIRWEKALGGKSPQERCNTVSPRLQQAYDDGTISIITNGRMNNQPVICTAREYGGDCVTLLITLRPQDNSLQVLKGIEAALWGRSIGPLRHTSDPQVYYQIDIEKSLRNAPVEQE